jgi:hypothetical protein
MKAAQLCRAIDDEREGKPRVVVLGKLLVSHPKRPSPYLWNWICADEADNDPEKAEFWALLGGFGPVKSAAEGGPDDAAPPSTKKLFRLGATDCL